MAMGKNIRQQRKARGWTLEDLSARSGVDVGTISALENRDSERSKYAPMLARALGLSVEVLNGEHTDPGVSIPAPLLIEDEHPDFVGVRAGRLRLSAGITGFTIDVEDEPSQPIFFRRDWLRQRGYNPARLHALKVRGRSMEPTLYEDDMVVYNTADTALRDDAVFVINFAGEAVVKRLIQEGPHWWMHSDNPDQKRYPRVLCDENCLLIGRVVHRQSERL